MMSLGLSKNLLVVGRDAGLQVFLKRFVELFLRPSMIRFMFERVVHKISVEVLSPVLLV